MASDRTAKMSWDATVSLDHIIATMTYVIWREEHLYNVSVLQGIPFQSCFEIGLHICDLINSLLET
jgi:hypothetical protein